MKIENDKIIEATETELYRYWLKQYSEIFSFMEYLKKVKDLGVRII